MNTNNWLNITGAASKVANIKIHGVIGGDWYEEGVTAEQVEADLEVISNIKAQTIKVDLDSLGGSVKHGMKIYNMLKANPANIEINVTGWTASMGTVIAMAADKGSLKMVDNNHFLIHEARTYTAGTKSQLEADAKFLENINSDIADIYAERTGISKEEALALMGVNGGEGEFWNASETLSKGFIDSTYKPEKGATASVTKSQLKEYKINAKLNPKNKNNMFNKENILKTVKAAYDVVINKFEGEEKNDAKNIEEGIDSAVNAVVDSLQVDVDAFKEEKELELTAKVSELEAKGVEFDELQAKYDVLNAGSAEPKGGDANLEGKEKGLSESDKVAAQFVASLSDSDKILFEANKEKK